MHPDSTTSEGGGAFAPAPATKTAYLQAYLSLGAEPAGLAGGCCGRAYPPASASPKMYPSRTREGLSLRPGRQQKCPICRNFQVSPLTDSNRRPPPYHGGSGFRGVLGISGGSWLVKRTRTSSRSLTRDGYGTRFSEVWARIGHSSQPATAHPIRRPSAGKRSCSGRLGQGVTAMLEACTPRCTPADNCRGWHQTGRPGALAVAASSATAAIVTSFLSDRACVPEARMACRKPPCSSATST